jgi:hypothetical protein
MAMVENKSHFSATRVANKPLATLGSLATYNPADAAMVAKNKTKNVPN